MNGFRRGLLLACCGVLICAPSRAEGPTRFYMEMVRVQAGGYWVATREVTQAQYEEITGENPECFSRSGQARGQRELGRRGGVLREADHA